MQSDKLPKLVAGFRLGATLSPRRAWQLVGHLQQTFDSVAGCSLRLQRPPEKRASFSGGFAFAQIIAVRRSVRAGGFLFGI